MITYLKPSILKVGNSEELIKGECGWGVENVLLDETDATKGHTRKYTHQVSCPGPGVITVCTVCRTTHNACSNESSNC